MSSKIYNFPIYICYKYIRVCCREGKVKRIEEIKILIAPQERTISLTVEKIRVKYSSLYGH